MAGEEDGFLEALKADPESSDPREVYADWLEEHGRLERAEYLRLEAEVRGFDFVTGNPEREQKKARRDELEAALVKGDATWLAGVSRVARTPRKHPRPSGLGLAEPIATKSAAEPATSEPRPDASKALPSTTTASSKIVFPMRGPLEPSAIPGPAPSSNRPRYLFEILLAVALVLLVKDVTTRGFLARLIERIYIQGHF